MRTILIFAVCIFFSGCANVSYRYYRLSDEQQSVVRDFTGYEKSTRDRAVWDCYKHMLILTKEQWRRPVVATIALPFGILFSPLCLLVPTELRGVPPTHKDLYLKGELAIAVTDNSGNPRSNFDMTLNGTAVRTDSVGVLRIHMDYDDGPAILKTTDEQFRFLAPKSSRRTPVSSEEDIGVSFSWDTSGDVAQIVCKVSGEVLTPVSNLVVADTKAVQKKPIRSMGKPSHSKQGKI